MYIKTLHLVDNDEEADAFNEAHANASEIYTPEFAIPYGVIPHGRRFESLVINYSGTRSAHYEKQLAQYQRQDIARGFSD